MNMPVDLLLNALAAGLLLGAFYAAVTIGVSISFGMLDIVNIAHPGFIILGSYIAYIVNTRLGIDPIIAAIVLAPAFYALGALIYQVYYASFERYGQESLRGGERRKNTALAKLAPILHTGARQEADRLRHCA